MFQIIFKNIDRDNTSFFSSSPIFLIPVPFHRQKNVRILEEVINFDVMCMY